MAEPITARDLENYQKAVENSGEKVASALREIALHFGAIGQQLTQSARADEDIKTAIVSEAARMCKSFEQQASSAAKQLDDLTGDFKDLISSVSSKLEKIKEMHYDARMRNAVLINVLVGALTFLTIVVKTFFMK